MFVVGILLSIAVFFALNRFSLENYQGVSFGGSGTSFASKIWPLLINAYLSDYWLNGDANILYQDNQQGLEIESLLSSSVTFASIDNPLSHLDKIRDYLYAFPFVSGAIVPVINFPDKMHIPFKLTQEALVGIFNSTIKNWCDPIITANNPAFEETVCKSWVSTNIYVAHRSKPSGTNYIFTSALSAMSPEWAEKYGSGLTTQWPGGVVTSLNSNQEMIAFVAGRNWTIGYTPVSYLSDSNLIDLTIPLIENARGHFVSHLNYTNSIQYGINNHRNSTKIGNTTVEFPFWYVDVVNRDCEYCYPICGLSYMVLKRNYLSDDYYFKNVYATWTFAKFIYSSPGSKVAEDNDFDLPQVLAHQVEERLPRITFNSKPIAKHRITRWDYLGLGLCLAAVFIAVLVRFLFALIAFKKRRAFRRTGTFNDSQYNQSEYNRKTTVRRTHKKQKSHYSNGVSGEDIGSSSGHAPFLNDEVDPYYEDDYEDNRHSHRLDGDHESSPPSSDLLPFGSGRNHHRRSDAPGTITRHILSPKSPSNHTIAPTLKADESTFRHLIVSQEDFQIGREIGSGSFGKVYLGIYQGSSCAIKHIQLSNAITEEEREQVTKDWVREAGLLSSFRHFNIIQLYAVAFDKENLYLITEYYPNGSVDKLLTTDRKVLPIANRLQMIRDTCAGILAIHSRGGIHCDIKPQNLLVDGQGVVKVADFGQSKIRTTVLENKDAFGTIQFMAPEIIPRSGPSQEHDPPRVYTTRSDIYSLGILMWQIWTGMNPYDEYEFTSDILDLVQEGGRPPIDLVDHEEMAQLIQNCWNQDPEKRPPILEVVNAVDSIISSIPLPTHTPTIHEDDTRTSTQRGTNPFNRYSVLGNIPTFGFNNNTMSSSQTIQSTFGVALNNTTAERTASPNSSSPSDSTQIEYVE